MSQYNFDLKFQAGKYTVQVDTGALYGYFEHNALGEDSAGGLWFDLVENLDGNKLELIDQDGTESLPRAVYDGLIANGFIVDEDFV